MSKVIAFMLFALIVVAQSQPLSTKTSKANQTLSVFDGGASSTIVVSSDYKPKNSVLTKDNWYETVLCFDSLRKMAGYPPCLENKEPYRSKQLTQNIVVIGNGNTVGAVNN